MNHRPHRVRVVGLLAAVALSGAGCAGTTADPSVPSAAPTTARPTTQPTPSCPDQGGFDCTWQQRFAEVNAYVAGRPGTVGIVVRDRQTGAVWRNADANTPVWTASTIKLAMVVNLFERDRAGTITLTSSDRGLIQAMLHSSDDDAADALWYKYAGADHMAFNNAFSRYGMTSLRPQRGYSQYFPYWGFQKCTPEDLDRLINYVLTQTPADTRDYIVRQLQTVDPDQQWGVWGAGPQAAPGNKDGWSEEDTGWVMNTVGFAGPGQRYTLAIMNSLNGHGGYDDGRTTDSHIAELLFGGRQP